MPEKTDGTYDLTFTARDGAGNTSSESSVFSLTVDTIAPSEPSITTTTSLTDDSTPEIEGVAEAGTIVTLLINGSTSGVTVSSHESSGLFSLTAPELGDGTYDLTFTARDGAGNTSSESSVFSLTVDTIAPSEPSITTTTSLTNDSTPAIEGTAEAGSTVTLFVDGVTTGVTATADETSGAYTIAPTSALGDGDYALTVTATDAAGNTSAASSALSITIDATAPGKPSIITTTSLTNDSTPTIEGIAEAGSTVELFNGTDSLGTTTADATTGAYSITTAALDDGDYSLTVTATDEADNTSESSDALSITIDATAPAQPSISTTTSLTNDSTPAIEGTAEAGSTVTLFVDGVTTGVTATADETTGAYTIAPTATLGDGTYALTVTSEDEAGNTSAASDALSITIDATIEQPTITTTADQLNSDDATPTIDGTAEAGSTVNLLIGGNTVIATTTADESGEFSITTPSLFDNDYSLTVTSEDAAGNTSTSDALSITIDTGADANPVITTTDSATNDATPSITGLARPGSTVTLFIGCLLYTSPSPRDRG